MHARLARPEVAAGTAPDIDAAVVDAARAFNRKLAWAPRFRVRSRLARLLIQFLLRASQVGAARRLARRGIALERRVVTVDGVDVALRILRPAGPVRALVLDVHGGGWVIGNAAMDDARNAALALDCGAVVVAVDYTLFGRASLDRQIDECLAALRWTLDAGLPEWRHLPATIVGESAGAHLAAAALLRLRAWPDLLARLAGAVLYYGVYDIAGTPSVRRAGADTLVLDGPGMVAALAMLTPGLDEAGRRAPRYSPLYGDLAGLPPALMIVGAIDPLRDDTVLMARRWREVAAVELHVLPQAPHGFIHFPTRMAALALAHAQAWIAMRITEATTPA